jgi:hypothetical protein
VLHIADSTLWCFHPTWNLVKFAIFSIDKIKFKIFQRQTPAK